ncbi:hypothetical protein Nepgr_023310 [Nepenthes gracilis]|uniref:Uncharacterized protein n=1 Tax=Nepenthes gracilis TaxID=150966 RepID=A0AAD3T0G8_NEPGR|nr:hypothetical protein Nepgr_023310 [Nepenthes gracilis]
MTKEFHELQTTVLPHVDWPSVELDGEPIAAVLNTGNPFHFSLPANPSTSEQILSFKPAKDSGGADLAELGKMYVKCSDLGSLSGDDEAPQPKESTLAQAFLSVISSVHPAPEKSMLGSCGQPCSGGKNRQWLLYSLRCLLHHLGSLHLGSIRKLTRGPVIAHDARFLPLNFEGRRNNFS